MNDVGEVMYVDFFIGDVDGKWFGVFMDGLEIDMFNLVEFEEDGEILFLLEFEMVVLLNLLECLEVFGVVGCVGEFVLLNFDDWECLDNW